MHHAPAVYVPTQPEGNGLTMPTLLSLLAHGLVIGMLVYSYQNSEVEMAGSIETVMVSPEQLADMQGQILANRAAAQAASASSSASTVTQANESDSNDTSQNSTQPSSQQVPSFSRPDDTTGRPLLMSEEHHQRLLEQNREYEQRIAELAEQLDESIAESHNPIQEKKQKELEKSKAELEELRYKQQHPDIIMRPTKADDKLKSKPSGSDNAPQNYNLADDGESVISGDTANSSTTKDSNRSTSSSSRGASNSEIINLIKRNYNPPIGAKGSTQRATLTITVNTSGKVTKVSVSGPDGEVNEAAKQAAWDAGSFPIDTSDPKYPTFNIEFKGSN